MKLDYVRYLPEAGRKMLADHDKLIEAVEQAEEAVRKAKAVVRDYEKKLTQSITELWTPAEIEEAKRRADESSSAKAAVEYMNKAAQ